MFKGVTCSEIRFSMILFTFSKHETYNNNKKGIERERTKVENGSLSGWEGGKG